MLTTHGLLRKVDEDGSHVYSILEISQWYERKPIFYWLDGILDMEREARYEVEEDDDGKPTGIKFDSQAFFQQWHGKVVRTFHRERVAAEFDKLLEQALERKNSTVILMFEDATWPLDTNIRFDGTNHIYSGYGTEIVIESIGQLKQLISDDFRRSYRKEMLWI